MKFAWQVILVDGSSQGGVVEDFDAAIAAIKAWFGKGDGAGQGDLIYQIVPV